MTVAKVGPLEYNEGGKKRIEHVSARTLFEAAHLDSLKMKPITREHPSDRLDSQNVLKHQRGMTGHSVVIDGGFLGVVGTIVDQELIDEIVQGDRMGCSLGYECDVVPRSDGTYDQVDRRVNHLAICERPRAGKGVRVQLREDAMRKKKSMPMDEEETLLEDMDDEMEDDDRDDADCGKKRTGTNRDMAKGKQRAMSYDKDEEDELIEDMDDEDEEDEDDELVEDGDEEMTEEERLVQDSFQSRLEANKARAESMKLRRRNDSLKRAVSELRQELATRTDAIASPSSVIAEWEQMRTYISRGNFNTDALENVGVEYDQEMDMFTVDEGTSMTAIKRAIVEAAGVEIDLDDEAAVDVAYRVITSSVMRGLMAPPSSVDTFKKVAGALRNCDSDVLPVSDARRRAMQEAMELGRKPLK